jgi:imidazole glycerol-phosphate synthase subunit HisF
MFKTRMIPCLLMKDGGFVKTIKFKKPYYLGDPINITRIFNDKEVDELVILDIRASIEGRPPDLKKLGNVASECFMPLAYGGGIRTIQQIQDILRVGFEKVIINSFATDCPEFIKEAADIFGSQSIVVSIDVKQNFFGKYQIFSLSGTKKRGDLDLYEFVHEMGEGGAGEILLNSIDRDGTFSGYDIELVRSVSETVRIPTIACGGAGKKEDFRAAIKEGKAAAVAAGSFFVFHGPHRAVLINVPSYEEQKKLLDIS